MHMKKKIEYTIIILLFLVTMYYVISFFIKKYEVIELTNQSKHLLEYLYTLDEGDYLFNDGTLESSNKVYVSDEFFFNGNGKINIDKYGNVKFYINTKNKCINKTSEGNIELLDSVCNSFEEFNVKMIRNNSKISFTSIKGDLEYKISENDDYSGEWINQEYKDNLILNTYNQGTNYIWFKDTKGNISEVLKFSVECLETENTKYNSDIFYCSGSKIIIDNIDWIVIRDEKNKITLMTDKPLEDRLPHCLKEKSEYCYVTDNSKLVYKWSNSYINYYLNSVFINELSKDIKDKLKTEYICDEYDNITCNNEGCGGYSKSIINTNKWNCTNYTSSKIRLLSFNEYNYIYSRILDNESIVGEYWLINSFNKEKGSIVDQKYEVYVLEQLTNEVDVRPVITISK